MPPGRTAGFASAPWSATLREEIKQKTDRRSDLLFSTFPSFANKINSRFAERSYRAYGGLRSSHELSGFPQARAHRKHVV
jgi:hypothetical protein